MQCQLSLSCLVSIHSTCAISILKTTNKFASSPARYLLFSSDPGSIIVVQQDYKNIRRAGCLEVINPEVAVELHISMVLSDTSSTKGSSSHCSGKDSATKLSCQGGGKSDLAASNQKFCSISCPLGVLLRSSALVCVNICNTSTRIV